MTNLAYNTEKEKGFNYIKGIVFSLLLLGILGVVYNIQVEESIDLVLPYYGLMFFVIFYLTYFVLSFFFIKKKLPIRRFVALFASIVLLFSAFYYDLALYNKLFFSVSALVCVLFLFQAPPLKVLVLYQTTLVLILIFNLMYFESNFLTKIILTFYLISIFFTGLVVYLDFYKKVENFRSEYDLESIILGLDEVVMLVDSQGNVIGGNPALEEKTGYSIRELLQKNAGDVFLHDEDKAFMKLQTAKRKDGVSNKYKIRMKTKEEEDLWVITVGTPLKNRKGEILGSLGIMTDITELTKKEKAIQAYNQELSRSNEKLQQSNNDLQDFARIAAHDLKTPIRNITGFSQLLLKKYYDVFDKDAKEYFDFIIAGTLRMQELIDGIRQYSTTGTNQINIKTTDLNQTLFDVISLLQLEIKSKKATVNTHYLPHIKCDPVQVSLLFQNLIENALKYSDKNRPPIISIEHSKLSDDIHQISVRDNGIGIPKVYSDQVFKLFKRVHVNHADGTGLGLALCKKIIDNHEWRIDFESKEGQGTAFNVYIPIFEKSSRQDIIS